jgi:hypothetical protein
MRRESLCRARPGPARSERFHSRGGQDSIENRARPVMFKRVLFPVSNTRLGGRQGFPWRNRVLCQRRGWSRRFANHAGPPELLCTAQPPKGGKLTMSSRTFLFLVWVRWESSVDRSPVALQARFKWPGRIQARTRRGSPGSCQTVPGRSLRASIRGGFVGGSLRHCATLQVSGLLPSNHHRLEKRQAQGREIS